MTLLVQITLLHLMITAILCMGSFYVQFVTYPRLKTASGDEFISFHKRSSKIAFIFFLFFMFFEAVTFYLMITVDPDASYSEWLPFAFMLVAQWIISFFFMNAIDEKLNSGKHDKIIKELINWNWMRICMWTLKTIILALAIVKNHAK